MEAHRKYSRWLLLFQSTQCQSTEQVQMDRATNDKRCDNQSAQHGRWSCRWIRYNAANEIESPGSSEDHHEDGEFSNPVSR